MVADSVLGAADLAPSIDIDCEISPALLDDHILGFIESLAPFGEANPAPVFLTRNARVSEARQVGQQGRHLKMRVSHSGEEWETIAFKQGDRKIAAGDMVDLVYTAGINTWRGRPTLQLTVLDFRPARAPTSITAGRDADAAPSSSGRSAEGPPQPY
jgi:single-stranded-DNA-specific exonuclease